MAPGLSAARPPAAPRINAAARLQGPGADPCRSTSEDRPGPARAAASVQRKWHRRGLLRASWFPQDPEIGLRPRCQLDRILLDGLPSRQTVALDREGISTRREIVVERDTGDASTDLITIGVNYWISELLLGVLGPQKPYARYSRRSRRGRSVRLERAPGRCAGDQRQEAESQKRQRGKLILPDGHDPSAIGVWQQPPLFFDDAAHLKV